MGESDLSDCEEQDDSGETRDELVFVEENTELPTSDEAVSRVGGEASSLSNQEEDGSHGLRSLLNEKRKGWTSGGSFLRIRFVTGFCSYTQPDSPSSLAHGVQGFFASHLCS